MTNPTDILRKYWGFDHFRPLQEEIILSALQGNDALALLPTGGGKSICFQVPALCMEGVCIVVSPLIALMKDQVANLAKRGITAAAIFSGMAYREIDRILDNAAYGGLKFLYLSPERLTTELVRERIKRMNVCLLAVDEAHCISQWGYDFRPPYLKIAEIRDLLPTTPVLALTATATPAVVEDIQEKLLFRKKCVFQKSFSRPNLAYVVLNEENKQAKLLDILSKVKGAGVVYVRNRKQTKDIARFLRENKIIADFYHAGLPPEERSAKQEAWISGKIPIMACTNAFGMGIDKPDVRTVVHMDLPDSLEAYFQEAGRAGRDGKKSYAVLLYSEEDKRSLERNLAVAFPPLQEIRQTYRALGSYFQLAVGGGEFQSFDFDIADFCKNFKLDVLKTYASLKILEMEGWIALTESVWMPSSYMVLVTREQLYDFQLKHPQLDLVVKSMLRLSEGSFQHFVPINEAAIARLLKTSPDKVLPAINQLHKERIIEYRPMKDKPQLVFTQERVDANNLTIDQKTYEQRKERHQKRVENAIAYATTARCRSQQLLAYFGEDSTPCGSCDVCLGRTTGGLSTDDFERYKLKIKQLITAERITEHQLLEAFATNRQPNVLQALAYLMDEGQINVEGNFLVWKKDR